MEIIFAIELPPRLYERFPATPERERVTFRTCERTRKGKAKVVVAVDVAGGGDVKAFFRGIGNTRKRAKEAAARCAVRELTKRNLF